uniref:Adenine DNA glycosylase n=1 Tax=Nelumbo nucifera TaxID=4432 RepID=A0A822ZNG2_NELNU|nr:TPA_asm: hypothetical protein HUJ06_001558 [Nelumbo nucifera]
MESIFKEYSFCDVFVLKKKLGWNEKVLRREFPKVYVRSHQNGATPPERKQVRILSRAPFRASSSFHMPFTSLLIGRRLLSLVISGKPKGSQGAKLIVERGEFPKTVSALREIPGIGDYTAGAIASIAFKETVPVVDGNVVRVIARLKAISANPKEGKTIKSFWKLAGQLVDPLRPGDFNQALMELGATICNPSSPSCSTCPISEQCHALSVSRNCQSIQVTDYPTKIVKAEKRCDFAAVCVVEISEGPDIQEGDHKSKGFLLVKRPEEGLLAGLWEFPSVLLGGEVNLITRRKVMDQYLKKSFNLDAKRNCSIALREVVGEYVHIFSHIQLRMYVELMVLHLKGGENIIFPKMDKETVTWKLVDGKSIQSMGLTSGVRKVYNMIQKFKKSRLSKNPTNHKGKRI